MRFVSALGMLCLLAPTAGAEKTERPAKKQVTDEFVELTNDPVLGKADSVRGTERTGLVAFTFDDGPDPVTTPAVLDACEKYNIPATFFIVTERLVGDTSAKPREVLARMLKAGFLVASHTVTHPNLRRSSTRLMSTEIDDSIRTLAKEAARPIALFRAPFGAVDKRSRDWLKKRGLTEVRWSLDTFDWQAKNAELLRINAFNLIVANEGGVILMHDIKPLTAQIVASVFDDLEAENCLRLAYHKQPIVPVSLHYFLRDNKQPRAIPLAVKKRTDAYRAALPARCAKRTPIPPPTYDPAKNDPVKVDAVTPGPAKLDAKKPMKLAWP